jgi:CBS domain-containing protein
MSPFRRLRVADIMSEHVVTGRSNDSLSRIAGEMEQHKIGSVVIVENRRVIGILTERDFVRIARQRMLHGRDRAKHYMTSPVVTVKSDAPLADAIRLMRKKHVRHLPVLDRNRRLVGIVGSRDLMKVATEVASI